MSRDIHIIATGVANLASVAAGLRRAGGKPQLTTDPDVVRSAAAVVLPGVGSFGAAMNQLEQHSLVEPLRERFQAGLPTLAICVGMQLLCESSEESPGVAGLGIVPQSVARFPREVRVPQLGWNEISADAGCQLLESGCAYFANSYRLETPTSGWRIVTTEHGGNFISGLERGSVLACQFHPELSGKYGLLLLARWVVRSQQSRPCSKGELSC